MIEITLLIVGTIIGAGFATGAEIVAFFGEASRIFRSGSAPLPTPLIAFLIFISLFSLLSIIIYLSQKQKMYTEIFEEETRKNNKSQQATTHRMTIKNIFFCALYFTLFTAMTAGITEITNVYICVLSLIISVAVVVGGFDKMAKFNAVVVIVIVIILPTICLPYLAIKPTVFAPNLPAVARGIISALLYGAMNCCMLEKIIGAAPTAVTRRKLYLSALMSSVIIAIFAYLILHSIRVNNAENFAVPLLAVSNNPVTFVMILLAILTSQYSALFSVTSVLKEFLPKTQHNIEVNNLLTNAAPYSPFMVILKNEKTPTIIAALLAFGCSFFGFSKLVGIFYPIIGAIIFSFLILSLLFSFLSSFSRKRCVFPHIPVRQTPPHSKS